MPYSSLFVTIWLTMNAIVYTLANLLRKVGYHFNETSDPRVIAMQKKIQELGGIRFNVEVSPDGMWTAESTNIDGILSSGRNVSEINEMLKDAIFTFFEVPPHLCSMQLIKGENETLTLAQRIYV